MHRSSSWQTVRQMPPHTDATELQNIDRQIIYSKSKTRLIVQTSHRLPYLGRFVVSAVLSRQVVQRALQASQT